MPTRLTVSTLILTSTLLLTAGADLPKRYDIRSGKILYEIRGSGDMMGMLQTQTKGKKRLIFDAYGANEITEMVKVTKETAGGKTKTKKAHTLTYMNGGILYRADFKRQKIIRTRNPAMAMGALFGEGKSMTQTGEAMLRKMGGKKIGTDTVAGQTCDVWKVMGATQCLYHGIPLKVETDIMGIKRSEVAVKIEWDLSLSKKAFKLPDFPITDTRGEPLQIDRSRLEALDAQQTQKHATEAAEGAAVMKTALEAAQKAGVKFDGKSKITEAQENAMANAMLPMMRKKFARQKAELVEDRKCLSRASTFAQAKRCERGRDHGEEGVKRWDAAEKKKILGYLDEGLIAMDCAMSAASMQAIEQCFSEEKQ